MASLPLARMASLPLSMAVLFLPMAAADSLDQLRSSLPGIPGTDYPLHWETQSSQFSCKGRVAGAYYADPSMGCQTYHICTARRRSLARSSFLCPNGTVFSQEKLICDWWFQSSCSSNESQYTQSEGVARGTGQEGQGGQAGLQETPRSKGRRVNSLQDKVPRKKSKPTSTRSKAKGFRSSKPKTTLRPNTTLRPRETTTRATTTRTERTTRAPRRPTTTRPGASGRSRARTRSQSSGRRGFPATRPPGFPASRPPGFPASRSPGFPASRSPGFPASRLPVRATQIFDSRTKTTVEPKPAARTLASKARARTSGPGRRGFSPPPSAPPLPLSGDIVQYDVSLPDPAEYDVLEYSVTLGEGELEDFLPSPQLRDALSP